jgi:hypothetical protein
MERPLISWGGYKIVRCILLFEEMERPPSRGVVTSRWLSLPIASLMRDPAIVGWLQGSGSSVLAGYGLRDPHFAGWLQGL